MTRLSMMRTTRAMGRRIVSLALLLGFLMINVGMPVSQRAPEDAAPGSPGSFSGQQHRCGCPTDSQWQLSCCCSSKLNRMAKARTQEADVAIADAEPAHITKGSCCDKHHAKPAGPKRRPRGSDRFAASESKPADSGSAPAVESSGSSLLLVPSIVARRCGGKAEFWLMISELVPVSEGPAWSFEWNFVGYVGTLQPAWPFAADSPPSPPPRA